jgi:hypothetical protein
MSDQVITTRRIKAKFALLQRQFLPKMYKSVGYLQNYPRTDKKKEKKKIQYTFEIFFLADRC